MTDDILDTFNTETIAYSSGGVQDSVGPYIGTTTNDLARTFSRTWSNPGQGLLVFLMRDYERRRATSFEVASRETGELVRVKYASPPRRTQEPGMHAGTINVTLEELLT